MIPRMQTILGILVFLLLPYNYCFAGEEEPIVWLADGISIKGTRQVELSPYPDDAGAKHDPDIIESVMNVVQTELTGAGLVIVKPVEAQKTDNVRIQIRLVHCQPGSVGGRWIGLGGGAALCIIRVYILDGVSGVQVGDIIVAEQVGSGGLFSIGAEKYVPKRAARKIAEELAVLLGIDLMPAEESE